MAERIPDSIIDDILLGTKKYTGEPEENESYSLEKIDSIVSSILQDEKPLNEEKTVAKKKELSIAKPKKEKKTFSLDIEAIKSIGEEIPDDEAGEVEISANDDGQLGLLADGEPVAENEAAESDAQQREEREIIEEKTESVTGQLSIEKTRMFNEVKIRGEHNPNIPHNLGNKVARTTTDETKPLVTPAVQQEEKYRKHFMNKPVQSIEKTQEHRFVIENSPHPKTIETPGVVIKSDGALKTDTNGFSPLPTLVSAEYQYEQEKTVVLDLDKKKDEVSDNQMVLEGFLEAEKVNVQPAEEAEAELRESRKGVVDDFVKNKIFGQEEETADDVQFQRQSVSVAREFFGPKDKGPIENIYLSEKRLLTVKTVFLSIICAVMAVLSAIAGAENGNFELYGNNEIIYIGVQLVLLITASCFCFKSFVNFFKSLKNKSVDMDTVVVIGAFVGIVQCLVGMGYTDSVESTASLFTAAAVVPMLLKTIGELIKNINDYENFLVLSDEKNQFYAVQNVEDEEVSNEIARGLMFGDPDIKYSAKIKFPARFVEISKSTQVTGKLLKVALPMVIFVGAVIGLVVGITTKNVFEGITTLTATVLMGIPVAAGLISSVNLRESNKKLNKEGGFINGYAAVEDVINSNGVVVDACDAFLSGGCNVEGIKLYHKMRIDEAILYTASVIIQSGGVLSDVFNNVIIGKQRLLHQVESLSYEERLGCSCWINNHRVLVGNRDLLVHHNVETPDEELEKSLKAQGKNVIFLAIEGKIAAMFVVVYKANEETAKYLRQIEKDGVTIFFRTSDANITEDFIEKEFGLPSKVVKIINSVAGDMFVNVKNQELSRADAKVIHNGETKTMLSSMHTAFVIGNFINTSYIIQLIAAVFGVAIVSVLALLSGLAQISVWQIIMYQTFWSLLIGILPRLRKN